jgi:predicted Zn-dependent protease with MMP-like domain
MRHEREIQPSFRIETGQPDAKQANHTMTAGKEANDWAKREAPSLAELEILADAAYRRLPDAFRQLIGDVIVRIEDFPTDEVLDSMGIDSPFDLLGLYTGVDLARKSVMDASAMPDMVFLYRRPILDYWAEHEETLGGIVTHVLVHEIGHHFGLSDADMEHIEAEVAA